MRQIYMQILCFTNSGSILILEFIVHLFEYSIWKNGFVNIAR